MEDVGFPFEAADEVLADAFWIQDMFGSIRYVFGEEGRFSIGISYGIPTTSLELYNEVLGKIESKNMFNRENLEQMQATSERISAAISTLYAMEQ